MSKNPQDIVLRGEHTKPLAQMLNDYETFNRGEEKDSILIYYTEIHYPNYRCVVYHHTYYYNAMPVKHILPYKEEVDMLLAMASIMNRNDFLKYIYDLYN